MVRDGGRSPGVTAVRAAAHDGCGGNVRVRRAAAEAPASMFPLWEDVVGPVLGAARPRLVVEIGALRGENTELLLSRLPADAELHVVDPLPDFDPTEHEARFAGRYVFHRDLSLNVLGGLPAMDAAIIDGDHNWYTVLPRAAAPGRHQPPRRSTAAAAGAARRRLAVRPAGPLLRPRHDPRRVPPAVAPRRHAPGTAEPRDGGRIQPDAGQRRHARAANAMAS